MSVLSKIVKTITKPIRVKARGVKGERKVDSKLNPLLFGRVNHRQINDLIIVDENNKSHQINHIEIDHIIPISKGGKSTYDNLQTLCHKCNKEKGSDFITKLFIIARAVQSI